MWEDQLKNQKHHSKQFIQIYYTSCETAILILLMDMLFWCWYM